MVCILMFMQVYIYLIQQMHEWLSHDQHIVPTS